MCVFPLYICFHDIKASSAVLIFDTTAWMSSQTQFKRLASPPKTQALSSNTFRPPPLDGSLTLAEIYDWHLRETPNHRLFLYADANDQVHTIYWPEAARAVLTGATLIRDRIGDITDKMNTPIIAILAASGIVMLVGVSCFRLTISRYNYLFYRDDEWLLSSALLVLAHSFCYPFIQVS